jgi:hypothetical protein
MDRSGARSDALGLQMRLFVDIYKALMRSGVFSFSPSTGQHTLLPFSVSQESLHGYNRAASVLLVRFGAPHYEEGSVLCPRFRCLQPYDLLPSVYLIKHRTVLLPYYFPAYPTRSDGRMMISDHVKDMINFIRHPP